MVANHVFHATCTGLASFPGSYMQGEPGIYSHVTMTYIIKIGPQFLEQKGNVFLHCSTNYAFNARCV